jgi:hypothetical protein
VPLDTTDRLARAARIAAAIIAVVGGLAVAVLVVTDRPPRLTAKTLVDSVEREVGSAALDPGTCRRRGPATWSCEVQDDSGSGGATYAVTVTSKQCWRARLTDDNSEHGMPRTASGCVH